jgi:hypothetical protein
MGHDQRHDRTVISSQPLVNEAIDQGGDVDFAGAGIEQ